MSTSPVLDRRPHHVSTRRLDWLRQELAHWHADGLVDADSAQRIRDRYAASSRPALSRLLLGLGAAFVGIGLLWLVAANLDQLSPALRFAGITALWLAAVTGAELLARRGDGAAVGALRLVAALVFGGVVFQAAQSLQVPAHDAGLVGAWGLGALLYAYAAVAVAPLVVGIVALVGWYVWTVVERVDSAAAGVTALLVAAVVTAAVSVVHTCRWQPQLAPPWRLAAALLTLVGLFVAALPFDLGAVAVTPALGAGVAVALLAAGAAALRADRTGRCELAAVVAAAGLGVLMLRWQPPGSDAAVVSGEALLRAVLAITGYLLAAAWFAALGVLREARGLTQLATAGLVLFTVVQSFAVFEPILSGAALFLALGAVLVGTGYLVDRGRRRLVADVAEVAA